MTKFAQKSFSTPANSKAYVDNWDRVFGDNDRAHRLDAPDGPMCACGQPSRRESGWCGERCSARIV